MILCTSRRNPKKAHKTPRKRNGYRRFRALSVAIETTKQLWKKKVANTGHY
jgi:hypothetical protein